MSYYPPAGFYFKVQIAGSSSDDDAAFSEVSGLDSEIEVEDGNTHSHDNMPILLGGRGGKKLNAGRHLKYAGAPPVANLFLTMLNTLGVAAPSFGNSTGLMTDLS